MEQVDQLEAMHEQRVELLTRSIRKVVQSKKRRREEGEEEVGGVSEKEGEEEVGGVSEKEGEEEVGGVNDDGKDKVGGVSEKGVLSVSLCMYMYSSVTVYIHVCVVLRV